MLELDLNAESAELAEALRERIDDLAGQVMTRTRAELPDWMVQPDLLERSREFARESMDRELAFLRDGAALPESCPDVDAEGAREGARAGVPLQVLLAGYRAGHAVQWEAWFWLVEDRAAESERRRALLAHGSAFFFAYADRISRFVTAEHMEERDRIVRTREQRRVHLVRELLDGAAVDPADIDYDLDRHHVGLVAWGPRAADAVRDLGRSLDRAVLAVDVASQTWWAWLGGREPLQRAQLDALSRFRPPGDTRLAVGAEAAGVEGFRQTHRQAVRAQRAAAIARAPVTRYEDVALELIVAQDPDEAEAFVRRELRGLDGHDTRARRLRATLEAYFAAGHNAAAAAAALGVHEQTVANRLRTVEDRIDATVASRRAELETALRLRRYLAP